MTEGNMEIQTSPEKLVITEGESITPDMQAKAAEMGDNVEDEPEVKPEVKTDEVPVEKVEESIEKESRTPTKTIPYGKFAEERRARKALEAEIALLKKQPVQDAKTGESRPMTEAEKAALDAQIAADPAKWVDSIVAKRMSEFERKYEERQYQQQVQSTLTSINTTFKTQPEAKDDPEFEENIAEIIQENPWLASAPPEKIISMVMREYRDARQSEAVKDSKEQVKAKMAEGSKVAKLAVADARSSGSVPGKKTWSYGEIAQMRDRLQDQLLATGNPKAYNDFDDEIELAIAEGRVK